MCCCRPSPIAIVLGLAGNLFLAETLVILNIVTVPVRKSSAPANLPSATSTIVEIFRIVFILFVCLTALLGASLFWAKVGRHYSALGQFIPVKWLLGPFISLYKRIKRRFWSTSEDSEEEEQQQQQKEEVAEESTEKGEDGIKLTSSPQSESIILESDAGNRTDYRKAQKVARGHSLAVDLALYTGPTNDGLPGYYASPEDLIV